MEGHLPIFTAVMAKGRIIIANERFGLTIDRLCHQLIETYDDFANTCMIGIQPRGVLFSDRMYNRIHQIQKGSHLTYGKLDITFYRDDFRTRGKPLSANSTEMDFIVEGRKVLLVDDVLYTGRTIQAAMTALQHYGRPDNVELLTLIDRRFNRHLPICSDYVGVTVDALDEAYVKVEWKQLHGQDRILLFPEKVPND